MAMEFAKLVLFSSVKSLLPFLVTRVEHWGEVLTFRGLLQALSKGLSFGREGAGCSPTSAQWTNKR